MTRTLAFGRSLAAATPATHLHPAATTSCHTSGFHMGWVDVVISTRNLVTWTRNEQISRAAGGFSQTSTTTALTFANRLRRLTCFKTTPRPTFCLLHISPAAQDDIAATPPRRCQSDGYVTPPPYLFLYAVLLALYLYKAYQGVLPCPRGIFRRDYHYVVSALRYMNDAAPDASPPRQRMLEHYL